MTREYAAEDSVYLKGRDSGSDVIQVADAPFTQDTCKEQGQRAEDYSSCTRLSVT
jgi:hypothetical protein